MHEGNLTEEKILRHNTDVKPCIKHKSSIHISYRDTEKWHRIISGGLGIERMAKRCVSMFDISVILSESECASICT